MRHWLTGGGSAPPATGAAREDAAENPGGIRQTSGGSAGPTAAPASQTPRLLPGLLGEADALIQQGKPFPALKLIERFLQTEPENPDAGWLHGFCLEQAGRHEESLRVYENLLARHPENQQVQQRRDLLASLLRRPNAPTLPSLRRPWNTGLPKDPMMQIQLGTHYYKYRGVPLIKNPFDFALYHLLIWNAKPRTIIEIGSKSGGSALWLGDLMNSFGLEGHVYSLDIVPVKDLSHPRVTFLEADGRDLGQYLSADFMGKVPRPLLVIEDADHSYETSSATLRFFVPWLRKEEHIIIEDGIITDMTGCESGPHRALREFLAEHSEDYEIMGDYCDFFGYNYTWCTNGYLKKVR
jgi:cephalosporin hydroxylase